MRRASFDNWPCSIARTVEVVGDAWTLVVLRELLYGERRFEGFVDTLGIARNTLTDRLNKLVERGVVERVAYQAEPLRHEYHLTEAGAELLDVLAVLNTWGDRWLAGDDGPPVQLRHASCDHDLVARVSCEHCGEPVAMTEIEAAPGPSYPQHLLQRPALARRFTPTAATTEESR